jgi:hypothetical protein
VSSIPPEDQFTQWRTEYESDILVSLASLAGERLFYGGDNSSGVSGDLETATLLAGLMQSQWGMGPGIASLPALQKLGIGAAVPEEKPRPGGTGIGFGAELVKREDVAGGQVGQRIEADLARLLARAEDVLAENRAHVLALAHALETHKTLSGEDVVAVLEHRRGPIVDGSRYDDPLFTAQLEAYHAAAVEAHERHATVAAPLPSPRITSDPEDNEPITGELVGVDGRAAAATRTGWPPPPLRDPRAEARTDPRDDDVSERGDAGPGD